MLAEVDRRGPATSVPHVGLKRRIPLCKPPPVGAGFSSQTSRSPPPLASQALPPLPCSASTLSSSLSQQPAFFLAAGAKLTSPARDQTQVQTCAERGRAGAGAVWRARLSAGSGAARALAYPLFLSWMLGHPSESFLPLPVPKRSVSSSSLVVPQTVRFFWFGPLGWGEERAVESVPGRRLTPFLTLQSLAFLSFKITLAFIEHFAGR